MHVAPDQIGPGDVPAALGTYLLSLTAWRVDRPLSAQVFAAELRKDLEDFAEEIVAIGPRERREIRTIPALRG
jgi:hypothetical protein